MHIKKNRLEWTVFALSLVLLIGIIGFLGRQTLRADASEPRLQIMVKKAQKSGAHWVVPVEVKNLGGQTAEGVLVEVAAKSGQNEETAEFQLDYLPRGSQREGFAVFTDDPKNAKLQARILGYRVP